jgi:hypothetical protein
MPLKLGYRTSLRNQIVGVSVERGGTRRAATSDAAFSGTPFPRSNNVTALVAPAQRGLFRRRATKPTAKHMLAGTTNAITLPAAPFAF